MVLIDLQGLLSVITVDGWWLLVGVAPKLKTLDIIDPNNEDYSSLLL